jgi:hypothetical protein
MSGFTQLKPMSIVTSSSVVQADQFGEARVRAPQSLVAGMCAIVAQESSASQNLAKRRGEFGVANKGKAAIFV